MSDFERVASVEELQPGGRLSVLVDDTPVLLLQTQDGYRAIEDVCTHDGQPLTDGPIQDGAVTCPRHGARFDLATGKPLCMPATGPLTVYEVKVESGAILLRAVPPGTRVEPTVPASHVPASDVEQPAQPATTEPAAQHSSCSTGTCSTEAGDDCQSENPELSLDQKMIEALRNVIDPELMINIVDLGLIYSINYDGRKAYIDMTLTSPACPAGPQIVQQSKMALERLKDVDEAVIKLVMTPPWSPDRMTDEARDLLGIF